MLRSLADGFRALFRSWGLAFLLLAVNGGLALVLAVPLAADIARELREKEAGRAMVSGFDHGWWREWADRQRGWTKTLAPDIFGSGFAFKNVDLLLKGWLPAGILAADETDAEADVRVGLDPLLLGFGVLYLLLQTFLTGGVLGVLRGPQGAWTVRGLLHGSGFYFGRMARVALVALLALAALFAVFSPLARWADGRAMEAVSETAAMAWTMGRHAVLLLAILFLSMVSCYAKVIVVLEERASAVLAWVSALGFVARQWRRAYGHFLLMALAGVLLLAVWSALDSAWVPTGYATQLVTLVLMQALVLGRIGLRVATLGGQVSLYRRFGAD
jgi:hypothetical protein